jgi:hypothetical protein
MIRMTTTRLQRRTLIFLRCPAEEKHWHGATPSTAMTHIAVQEALDGKVVQWMEKVTDEEYRR